MKKFKKGVLLLIAFSLIAALFVGCNDGQQATDTADETTPAPDVTEATVAPTESTDIQEPEVEQMCEVVSSNPLSDVRVRQAIAYAIDMDAIIDGLMGGTPIAANSLTPNNAWKADGLEDYNYDPEKAKALLAAAGWDSNYEVDLVYYYADQLTVDTMAAIQAYLGEVGIKVNPRKLEGDLGTQLWTPPEDAVAGPSAVEWNLCFAAIAAVSEYEYYNRFLTGGGTNSHTPGNAELDALLEQAAGTIDTQEQMEIFKQIQQFENTNLPVIPLYYQQIFTVESDRLTRNGAMYGNEQYNYDWKIQTWDIEADENGEKIMKANGGPVEFFETPFINPGTYTSTKLLYDHLIVADGNLSNFRGQLASDYSLSEDGLTAEFTLADDIKWHDGTDITAEDVKFTVELVAKMPAVNVLFTGLISALEGYQDYVDGNADEITGIVIDGNKVKFNFEKLFPNTLVSFSQLAIVPKAYLEDADPLLLQQDDFWQNPIGSGPYKIEDVSMNNYAVFVPFEEYHEGVGIIEQIQLYPSTDSDANLVKNAAAGDIDYAYTKSMEDVIALADIDNVTVIPFDMNYTRLLYVNKFPFAE